MNVELLPPFLPRSVDQNFYMDGFIQSENSLETFF